jgi:hypothetical protein
MTSGPKPNIAVTGGNLTEDNRAYGPQKPCVLETFRKTYSN